MTDPLAAASEPTETPAPEAPVLTAAQIEDMIQRKTDQRISGIQSLYDRKIKDLSDQLKKAERALAGTEDDPRESDLQAEVRRLERQNRMLVAAQANPEIAPYLDRFGADATPEDIAAALVEIRQSFSPPPAPPSAPEPTAEPVDVPGVEPNRPPRERQGWEMSTTPTPEQADKFFSELNAWPGLERSR